ncbi:helix-turn-helix domain-containing protein [Natrinema halophilum]|uniref:Helix-turn-helix domain-containing protein n=1 Tax=Natrinema halophilum TaxID=1699371 RepID=A0A7D5KQ58_9EURY|nr:helix-turn-helix domain-containing protein [Natrinema halophilum]QLG48017.1 helix-turn-helix domain-containing protein [Natrinema halophilum]
MTLSFIAELHLSHPDLPLTPTIESISTGTIEVDAQPLTAPGNGTGPTVFFSLRDADDRCVRTFESALARDHTVNEWQSELEFEDCRIYKIILSQHAKLTAPEISTLGVRILSIRSSGEGWQFQLQASDKERLGAYWQYCRDEDIQFTLEKLYSTGTSAQTDVGNHLQAHLTERQQEVARTATRMGYYESDGSSAAEVAAELDISPSTLSTHLRRITAKLFSHVFGS